MKKTYCPLCSELRSHLEEEKPIREGKMKALKAISKELKKVFEGNRCRFAKRCELYQAEGTICNNWYQRFPTFEKSYCGRYRSMKEDEDMLEEYDFSKGIMGKYSKKYKKKGE